MPKHPHEPVFSFVLKVCSPLEAPAFLNEKRGVERWWCINIPQRRNCFNLFPELSKRTNTGMCLWIFINTSNLRCFAALLSARGGVTAPFHSSCRPAFARNCFRVQPELRHHLENGSKWSWKGSEFSNACVVFLLFAKIAKCSAARP